MKNMQLAEEEASWKRLCLKELSGIKKLKRKSREPAKPPQLGGCRSFQGDLRAREHVLGGLRLGGQRDARPESQAGASNGAPAAAAAAPGFPEGRASGAGKVMDVRKPAFPAGLASPPQQPLRKDACLRSGSLNKAEGQAFADPSLQPRMMVCQQQPRPLESSYSSASHVIYSSNPDSSLSPRKRLGETAGVSSEIKAIQQTRRLLANARERTRVHTISAAFEALRKQVPCYSYGQKLSKLAILRIACNYILSLARLADLDYSADHSNMSFSECVEQCTRTLQAEGRSKKRKIT
ncbi:transcription factor ATOH8 isoform X2 [Rhineura floridana]|uniref:transcription factor ATOH8 isoform X2 n=1 Tax=Rhineura floridana TaxID=261503 RepID=UPI002AC85285|nr:transcription factor ATOH8 isoform X2 [Rhineura floridana]